MAVLVLPIAREATTEEKMKTCTDRRHPRTTEDICLDTARHFTVDNYVVLHSRPY